MCDMAPRKLKRLLIRRCLSRPNVDTTLRSNDTPRIVYGATIPNRGGVRGAEVETTRALVVLSLGFGQHVPTVQTHELVF